MKINAITGEGLLSVTTELNVLELQALASRMQELVELTIADKDIVTRLKEGVVVSSKDLINGRSARRLHKLTNDEAQAVCQRIHDLSVFVSKFTQDTPSFKDVNRKLFSVEEEHSEEA